MDAVTAGTPRRAARATYLPAEAPLAMPVQSLRDGRARRGLRFAGLDRGARAFVFGTALALSALAAYEMYLVLAVGGLTTLEAVILVLFVILFAWIALSFASTLGGVIALMTRTDAMRSTSIRMRRCRRSPARTALLLPTYNEDPDRVFSRVQAVYESVAATGALACFDVFILSDTTDPDIFIAEEAAFLALRERLGAERTSIYRHRPKNDAKKAGNIAEWVRRFGGHYEHMIVLDADSLMTGDTLVRLVAAMERNPGVGLIQTFPVMVNATTPFARVQQFAGRLYGPLIAYGLAWWHGADGNYWGHNAIIRMRAFAECAGLPALSGPRPIGGHILSHDFVEAALMRRGGWAIHMAPALGGSYEESPPSLTEYAARDRRWCQGNLQHMGVLPARGLHWVEPAASCDRHRLLRGGAAVAVVPVRRHPDFVAGAVHPAGILPENLHALSAMARAGSGARGLRVRRHDGAAARAEAHRLSGDAAGPRRRAKDSAAAARAFFSMLAETLISGPDRAGDDADPVLLGDGDPERPRQRLAGATPRRRQPAAARRRCAATAGTRLSACCWRSPPTGCRFRCSPG